MMANHHIQHHDILNDDPNKHHKSIQLFDIVEKKIIVVLTSTNKPSGF